MDLEKLEKLIELMKSSGLEELELEENKERVHLKLPSPTLAQQAYLPSYPFAAHPSGEQQVSTLNSPLPNKASSSHESLVEDSSKALKKKKTREIRSPFVGTFYSAAAPGADDYVELGQRISFGDKLCIVEAMKLMNEIEADCEGVVVDILIKNEQPVEYDQVLFLVE